MRALMLAKALVARAYQTKAEAMARAGGVDLTVFAPLSWPEGGRTVRLERDEGGQRGYELTGIPIALSGHFHVHWYPGLSKQVADVAPRVMHVDEEPYNLATVQALRAARRAGARTLFFTWQNLNRPLPPPFGWLEGWTYRHADGAIAGSADASRILRDRGYRGQVWVLPQFGVDATLFAPGPPRRAQAPDESCGRPFVVGYAGRLVPEKGVDLLLRATSGQAGWSVVIAGEGPARQELEATARATGAAERTRFLGALGSDALADFYRSLDVLVLPSRRTGRWMEQFGRVLTEAMACGVACVGSDTGEIPHVLGDAGITFPDGDAAALASVLDVLARTPERRVELGRRGRSRVLERYTMDHIARATVAIYREIAR